MGYGLNGEVICLFWFNVVEAFQLELIIFNRYDFM